MKMEDLSYFLWSYLDSFNDFLENGKKITLIQAPISSEPDKEISKLYEQIETG